MIKKLNSVLLLAIILLLIQSNVFAQTDYKWGEVNGVSSRELNSIAYGNGIFVAVGDFGRIETSTDGYKWIRRNSGTNSYLSDIVWNGSIFVAIGSNSTLLTSTDGINWQKRDLSISNNHTLVSICWNGTIFVASTNFYGIIITSNDGMESNGLAINAICPMKNLALKTSFGMRLDLLH